MQNYLPFYMVYLASVIVPASIGAYGYRQLKSEMKLLLALMMITLAVEGFSLYLALNQRNTNWIHHIYLPVEYALIGLIFSQWQKTTFDKNVILFSIPLFVIACIMSVILFQNLGQLNVFTTSLSCILYAVISSYTLYQLQKDDSGSLVKDCRFWVSSALLLYSAGALSFFAFTKFFPGIWYAHVGINIVVYITFAVGFICHIRH
jgi:hypothetical protein